MRDSFHVGWGRGSCIIELDRLLRFYRPAFHPSDGKWHMSFRASETENVMRIFSHRLHLRRAVYSHKTCRTIEAMFMDIFNALDPVLNLRDLSLKAANGDTAALDAFLQLDEYSLWGIASSSLIWPLKTLPGMDVTLQRSTRICRRIQTRQLYSLVGVFYAVSERDILNGRDSPDLGYAAVLLDKFVSAETQPLNENRQKIAIRKEVRLKKFYHLSYSCTNVT